MYVPTVAHDLDGRPVTLDDKLRQQLAVMIAFDIGYIYQAGTDPLFWNIWLNHEVDPSSPMGYRGVRIPLADWVRREQEKSA